MMRRLLLLLFALPLLSQAPDLGKLPDWAALEARSSLAETAPTEVDAWVLLQKTEFAYTGGGEIRVHQYRLVKILGERGLEEGSFRLSGLGGRTSKIKNLKGWNLRPDGEVVKLDRYDVVNFGVNGPDETYSTGTTTLATLDRVVKGSLVAFESLELITLPQGPADETEVLEKYPVRAWEVNLAKRNGWFTDMKAVQLRLEARNLGTWVQEPVVTPTSVVLHGLPALPKDEGLHPYPENVLPMIYVAFLDPDYHDGPSTETWGTYAGWMGRTYAAKFVKIEPAPLAGKEPRAGLEALAGWMAKELSYKAVFLTPERGWVPEGSAEVCRRHYGDCKDLTSCFAGGALALGLKPYPVLARIEGAFIPPDQPVTPYAFNHVITAVALKDSLGLAAEVSTPAGRFLLVDPTSRTTPFGWLPAEHRGRRVMICTETQGLWVDVPDAAIAPEHLLVRMKGAVSAEGDLDATLDLTEGGACQGLRTFALLANPKDLKDRLTNLLGLHGDATLEVLKVSDPADLKGPLVIHAHLACPKAMVPSWGEWTLPPIGLPPIPDAAQKPGRPRQYPVLSLGAYRWTCQYDLELPFGRMPRLTEKRLDTPFREAAWKAATTDGRFQGEFTVQGKDARYAFDQREEGVREAKKDRNQLKVLEEEALTFVAPKP